jgi:hypothetical protein
LPRYLFFSLGAAKSEREVMRLCPDFSEGNRLLFYAAGGRTLQLMDVAAAQLTRMELPFTIRSSSLLSIPSNLIDELSP